MQAIQQGIAETAHGLVLGRIELVGLLATHHVEVIAIDDEHISRWSLIVLGHLVLTGQVQDTFVGFSLSFGRIGLSTGKGTFYGLVSGIRLFNLSQQAVLCTEYSADEQTNR